MGDEGRSFAVGIRDFGVAVLGSDPQILARLRGLDLRPAFQASIVDPDLSVWIPIP